MLENEMLSTRLPKLENRGRVGRTWNTLVHSVTTWRVCSRKNLVCVLYYSLYPQGRKLFLPCWWAAQGKYHHKLATPSVHDAFNKQARGTSRTETHISPAALAVRVSASTNPAVCSDYFIFLHFLRDASLHTIVDLSLFLYKLSSLFLALVALAHCGCHCYKSLEAVASLPGCAGCSAVLASPSNPEQQRDWGQSKQSLPCALRKDEEGSWKYTGWSLIDWVTCIRFLLNATWNGWMPLIDCLQCC